MVGLTHTSVKRILLESLPILLVTSLISIIAGLFIESSVNVLTKYPILLLLLPAFIDACGDIGTTFAARLTTQFGIKIFYKKRRRFLFADVEATILLTIAFFLLVTFLAYGWELSLGYFVPPLLNFVAAVLIAALVVILVGMGISLLIAYIGFKHKLDPDNFEAPLLSTISDLAGVVVFISLAGILLA